MLTVDDTLRIAGGPPTGAAAIDTPAVKRVAEEELPSMSFALREAHNSDLWVCVKGD